MTSSDFLSLLSHCTGLLKSFYPAFLASLRLTMASSSSSQLILLHLLFVLLSTILWPHSTATVGTIPSACQVCIPYSQRRCQRLMSFAMAHTRIPHCITCYERARHRFHLLFTGPTGRQRLECLQLIFDKISFPPSIATFPHGQPEESHRKPQPLPQSPLQSLSSNVSPLPSLTTSMSPIHSQSPSLTTSFSPKLSPLPSLTSSSHPNISPLQSLTTSSPPNLSPSPSQTPSFPSNMLPSPSSTPLPFSNETLPEEFTRTEPPTVILEVLRLAVLSEITVLLPPAEAQSLRVESRLIRADSRGFPISQSPSSESPTQQETARPSPGANGAANVDAIFDGYVDQNESIKFSERFDSIHCSRANCAAQINVYSGRFLRRTIIRAAVRKLRQRASFSSVFDTSSRNNRIVRRGSRRFVVFFPFRQTYLEEFWFWRPISVAFNPLPHWDDFEFWILCGFAPN